MPGEGSVYQRSDGYWVAAIQVDGKRRTVYGKSERQAKGRLAELRKQVIVNGSLPDAGKRTVGDLLDDWLATVGPGLKAKSLLGYRQVLAHVRPVLGAVRLSKLEPAHLQRLYNALGAESARNAYKAHLLVHAALRMAVVWGWLPNNPADRVIKPKYQAEQKEVWTPDQLRAFLDATAEHWLHPLFVVAVSSGCRLGELVGLHWEDVDFAAGATSIRRNRQYVEGRWVESTPKTSAGRRTVALPPLAMEALRRQKALQAGFRLRAGADREDNPLVFTGQRGQPLLESTVETLMRGLVARLGLPKLTPHGLRHFNASALIAAGVPLPAVSSRLGHARPSVTLAVYSHLLRPVDSEAAQAIAAVLGG